jgi:hypothetical protein
LGSGTGCLPLHGTSVLPYRVIDRAVGRSFIDHVWRLKFGVAAAVL